MNLVAKYGITQADKTVMVNNQGGLCAICKAEMTKPFVDHCHTTGNIRGILCSACNSILGYARDSVATLKAAIDYLLSPPAQIPTT